MTEPGQSYDVVVIGGGPAGSVAAMETARLGRSAALIERAEKYRDKIGETVARICRTAGEDLGAVVG